MSGRTMVACVGNIFLGDDGFGVEVAQRLSRLPVPEHVIVRDVGIRGMHLALELLDGFETLILVDTARGGRPPGTITLIEPDPAGDEVPLVDAHGMQPDQVLATIDALGARPPRTLIVACEPASIEERIGLSDAVARAVDDAVGMVLELVGARARAGMEGERS